jgi:hypothetical protein
MSYLDLSLTLNEFNFLSGLTGLVCAVLIVYPILKRF